MFCNGSICLSQPENIVLKDRTAKQLKVIDFGTAQDLSINPKPTVMVGTPEFIGEHMAPLATHRNPDLPSFFTFPGGPVHASLVLARFPNCVTR